MSRNAAARRRLHLALTFLIGACLFACSGPPPRTSADPESTLNAPADLPPLDSKKSDVSALERERHIDDARAEIASAERVIQQSLAPAGSTPPVTAEPRGPVAGKPSDPKPAPVQLRGCEPACAALASMRRSGEYVCRLAGPRDEKCLDARARLQTAEARVTAAQCPCAGPSS